MEKTTASSDDWGKFIECNDVLCNECRCAPPAKGKMECRLCHANHQAGLRRILKDVQDKREFSAIFKLSEKEIIAGLTWFEKCSHEPRECPPCPWAVPCAKLIATFLAALEEIDERRKKK